MLVLRCARCKKKLLRYQKWGSGEVHRCHKSRIERMEGAQVDGDRLRCTCGETIGIDKGTFFKMVRKAFTYSGTKIRT